MLRPASAGVLAACLALGGCGSSAPSQDAGDHAGQSQPAAPAPDGAPSPSQAPAAPSAPAAAPGDAVPGYEVGQIPPVPLFTLPDLGLLTASTGALTPDLTSSLTSVPGISVSPGRCDEAGVLASGGTSTVLGGDGSLSSSDGDSSVVNNGDGSGVFSDGRVSIVNNGDGSGNYSDGRVSIVSNGDGSGNYSDPDLRVVVNGDGSGSWSNSRTNETIVVNGDGSGNYSNGRVSIVNNGDGTGNYSDGRVSIVNNGDGTALVGSQIVEADPLPAVGGIDDFPSIDRAQPVTSCGTVITLESEVLFDFGSAQVRPEAEELLASLAQVLNEAQAPAATITGHTDSISDDDFNQRLSQDRARAVVEVLTGAGTSASLTATGYGETQPVAPNENPDGSDNPAGRQQNRRVEILIPAF